MRAKLSRTGAREADENLVQEAILRARIDVKERHAADHTPANCGPYARKLWNCCHSRDAKTGPKNSRRIARTVSRLQCLAISELERGKRKYVTTADLVVLAAALNVAPVALLYPAPYDEEIEVTLGRKMSKIAAVERFSGILDPLSEDHDEEFRQNTLKLMQARQITELEMTRRNLGEQLRISGDIMSESVRDTITAEHARVSKWLEETRICYGG